MEETWIPVTIDGYSNYEVSSLSKIRKSNGLIMKPTKKGSIRLGGRNRYYSHVISCLAFHGPRPSKTHTVDHIDRDWKNNNINNLRWASRSVQSLNRKSYTCKGLRVIYKTPTGDTFYKSAREASRVFGINRTSIQNWLKRDGVIKVSGGTLQYDKLIPKRDSIIKEVPSWFFNDDCTKSVKVSTCGLILKNNGWTCGTLDRLSKYFSTQIGHKKHKQYMIHRLVASTFLGKPDDPRQIFVNHKDGNGLNNNIDNLEWCTVSENTQHAIDTGLVKSLRPVVQYGLNGIRLQEFSSIREASRYTNGLSGNICNACNNRVKSAYKFMWRYKSEAPEKLPPISQLPPISRSRNSSI